MRSISDQLRSVFELGFAFTAWGMGDEALRRLGLDPDRAKRDMGFNALKALGLKQRHVDELNRLVCGTQTVEGAPHLKDEHLPVFDCANKCGRTGTRFIEASGHIRMMAAAQPFISGAISKTINLPHEASVDDIKGCYRLSWELGLKANALYRDGCKLSQPLNIASDAQIDAEDEADEDPFDAEAARDEVAGRTAALAKAAAAGDADAVEEERARIVHRPMRRRLPDTRRSMTHKFNIAGHEGYLTVGLYEDGRPGELFITMAKEGSTIGGLMDSLGTATSVALQYGVPLESLVRKFTHQRFEPAGMTANREIPIAKSLVDYIFRWLGLQFIDGYRAEVAPQRDGDDTPTQGGERWNPTDGSAPIRRQSPAPTGHGDEQRRGASTTHGAEGFSTTIEVQFTEDSEDGQHHETSVFAQTSVLSDALDAMGDAPPCDVCGSITVRSGTCHKCLNCGNSMGCS